jgi:hypothetical protein
MFNYTDIKVMQEKIQTLEKEMFTLNKLIAETYDGEKDYLKAVLSIDLYLANLYIELMFDIPVVLKTVEKPRTINLMTFSKFVRDTKFLK